MILVSAIMPTRGRIQWAAEALRCFLNQTYSHRELIILDDSDDPSFPNGIHQDGVHYLRLNERLSIPDKRNKCCQYANGQAICHWDSDDHSAPDRMADQVKRLEESGKSVAGYHSIFFHVEHPERWVKYVGDSSYALGTSLCYRKSWWAVHPFHRGPENPNVGEDNAFVMEARQSGELVTADACSLMFARIHSGNTSIKHIGPAQMEYRAVSRESIPAEFQERITNR